MKRKILKLSIIAFVSILIAGSAIGYIAACSGGDYDDEWVSSFFAPENARVAKGDQLLFKSMLPFYKVGFINDFKDSFEDQNIWEWFSFFNRKVPDAELRFFLYNARLDQIDASIFYLKNNAYPIDDGLKRLSLLSYEKPEDAKEFLFYLGFAKRCEPYTTYIPQGWDDDPSNDPRTQHKAIDKLLAGGTKQMQNAASPFIKERYAYQLVRLYFMKSDYSGCIDFYNQHKSLFTQNNTIQYRAMGYAAGAYYKEKSYGIANYLYSIVFDKCEPLRLQAYQSFHPQNESDWMACLAMAKNEREKEVLWQMLGIYVDPFRAMKEIYTMDPKSDLLDLLLARAINTEEEQFLPYYSNYDKKDTIPSYERYAFRKKGVDRKLLDFVCQVAHKGDAKNIPFWQLSAGYLNIAVGEYSKAEPYLAAADHYSSDPLVCDQLRLLRLISLVETSVPGNSTNESNLKSQLQWLASRKFDADLRYHTATEWCYQRLSEKYAAVGDSIRAECLDLRSNPNFYLNSASCEAMKSFMDRPQMSDFDQFILARYPYSKNMIVEFQAIQLALQHKFKDAQAMLYKIRGAGSRSLNANPFVIHINDCHECDQRDNTAIYSIRSFIETMVGLENLASSEPTKAADHYFQLANGCYNITYFGNSRAFYISDLFDRGSIYIDWRIPNPNDPIFDCSKAQEYYVKAMNLSHNPEFKAECAFMAAKCEQNNYYIHGEHTRGIDFKAGKYFKMLRDTYSLTAYYNEVISECGYFKTYINGNK